jgi:hypothetical protein
MSESPEEVTQWVFTVTADADVVHGDPDRCTDDCEQRCAAEREKRTS